MDRIDTAKTYDLLLNSACFYLAQLTGNPPLHFVSPQEYEMWSRTAWVDSYAGVMAEAYTNVTWRSNLPILEFTTCPDFNSICQAYGDPYTWQHGTRNIAKQCLKDDIKREFKKLALAGSMVRSTDTDMVLPPSHTGQTWYGVKTPCRYAFKEPNVTKGLIRLLDVTPLGVSIRIAGGHEVVAHGFYREGEPKDLQDLVKGADRNIDVYHIIFRSDTRDSEDLGHILRYLKKEQIFRRIHDGPYTAMP